MYLSRYFNQFSILNNCKQCWKLLTLYNLTQIVAYFGKIDYICKKSTIMEKKLKKYSASYTNLNPNFCITDSDANRVVVSKEDKSIIAVIRNVLNRGILSTPSSYLREKLGSGKRCVGGIGRWRNVHYLQGETSRPFSPRP